MKKIGILLTAALMALVVVGAVSGSALSWRVLKSKTVSGQFAATATSATINDPRGIAVRFRGSGVHGMAAWGCSKGLSVSSWSRQYGPGLHTLGHVRSKDSCNVVASISGNGRVTVQILKWR
jgi:hypothetical protein